MRWKRLLQGKLSQRARFEEQEKELASGDAEANHINEDFLKGLNYM